MGIAFNFIVNILRTTEENGSMSWTISDNQISILYYFNNENLDLQKILDILNSYASRFALAQRG